MANNENTNLNNLGDNIPRRRPSITTYDLNNDSKTQTVDSGRMPNITTDTVTGSNSTDIKEIDINKLFPKKPEPQTVPEDDPFAMLDAAVEREKKSISKRIDDVIDMQNKEIEEKEANEEFADVDKMIDGESNSNNDITFESNDESTDVNDSDDEYKYTPINNTDNINRVFNDNIITEPNNTELPENDIDISALNTNNADTDTTNKVEDNDIPEKHTDFLEMKQNKKLEANILDGVDNDSLFDDDEDEPAEETDDNEVFENLKQEVKKKLAPTSTNKDLSKFIISKKGISAEKINNIISRRNVSEADWVLYGAEKPISVTALSGPEILKLNPQNSSRNRLNTFKDIYRIIYDHIIDDTKPNYETWLKTTRFSDLQHIYFALYMATFNGSNFITFQCPHCKNMFIKDIDFMDMVSYKDDNVKAKVEAIRKMDTNTPSKDMTSVDLIQISRDYAFAIRQPSIWNVVIEVASLSDNFLEKYASIIDLISYIDMIYFIDDANNTLVPINAKPVPNDIAKTSARRIAAFYNIINNLDSDNFYTLRSKINEYDDNSNAITYKIPGVSCPECARDIPENTEITPENMLFTRHQLAAIRNM